MWPALLDGVLWFALGHPAAPLGGKAFATRERAAATLVALGEPAEFAVRLGGRHTDPEIGERCRSLKPAVVAASRRQRLDRFINDPSSHPGHLPGAVRFLTIT